MPARCRLELSMTEASRKSRQQTSRDTQTATSSQVSVAGHTPFDSLDGQMGLAFGQGAVRVKDSALPGYEEALTMRAISGPPGTNSSASASLQSSLESSLRRTLGERGTPLYALTWRRWDIPWGAPICALRASPRRMLVSVSFGAPSGRPGMAFLQGHPTPMAGDHKGGPGAGARKRGGFNSSLPVTARLAGHPTPIANDAKGSDYCYGKAKPNGERPKFMKAPGVAKLCGWGTVTASEPGRTVEQFMERKRRARAKGSSLGVSLTALSLQVQLVDLGPTQSGGSVDPNPPESDPQYDPLNPDHSRWLQGYPRTWALLAPTETPSSRK